MKALKIANDSAGIVQKKYAAKPAPANDGDEDDMPSPKAAKKPIDKKQIAAMKAKGK